MASIATSSSLPHHKVLGHNGSPNPNSKTPKLPNISKLSTVVQKQEMGNPFQMPSDVQVFAMREEDRRAKHQAKELMKKLSIYEKNQINRKNFKALLAEDDDDVAFYQNLKKRDDKILLNRNRDRHMGKENLHEFISKKREMFLVQYALGVKREEMRKLEEIAQTEEQKLLDDEKALEEDAAKFDAFLKENDKNSVEAIKKAESETKAKLEKIQDIKKINVQIMSIRSDMSKNEDQLKDLQRYRHFLEKLTPHDISKKAKKEESEELAETKKSKKDENEESVDSKKPKKNEDEELADDDYDVYEGTVYFQTPEQLLDLYAELEENNLALIQNCQETEETLEDLRSKINATSERMERETMSLNQQINLLNAAIQREEEKSRMLEERTKAQNTGNAGGDSQKKLLDDLNFKVKDVYRRCLGDCDGNLSMLQMLTSIENRLEQLFEFIELMPHEKMKDKERRQRLREEKLEAQRALQEERILRAQERARAPVKKKTGKPVVFRSAPPQKKKAKGVNTKKKVEEDLEYYWT